MSQLLSKFLTVLAIDPLVQQAISANSGNPNELRAYLLAGGATKSTAQKFPPLSPEETDTVIAAQGKSVTSSEYERLVNQIKDGFCTAWSVHSVIIDGRIFTVNETDAPLPSPIHAAQIVIGIENAGQ